MKKRKKIRLTVTEEEEDLIQAIRNWVKSYPNGRPELKWYAQHLFDEMIDMPKGDAEFPLL